MDLVRTKEFLDFIVVTADPSPSNNTTFFEENQLVICITSFPVIPPMIISLVRVLLCKRTELICSSNFNMDFSFISKKLFSSNTIIEISPSSPAL